MDFILADAMDDMEAPMLIHSTLQIKNGERRKEAQKDRCDG